MQKGSFIMKSARRLFALLLTLAMVLTYMPAAAFAEGESDSKSVTKIEYSGSREYSVEDGEPYFYGFWEPGNTIVLTWDDNSTSTYVSKSCDYYDVPLPVIL